MKEFKHFNKKGSACIVCGKKTDKPCRLVPNLEERSGMNVACEVVHSDCIDLCVTKLEDGRMVLHQLIPKKNEKK